MQVLFAFLLTVPFSQRFGTLEARHRTEFFAAFLATALATVFLMAPTAHHRLRWRKYDKERLLNWANRFAIAGLLTLTVAIGLVVYVIGDVVYGTRAAGFAAGGIVAAIAWFWYGLPLLRLLDD